MKVVKYAQIQFLGQKEPKNCSYQRTSELVLEHWKRFRKAFPNLDKGRNCFFGSTTRAFPGTTPSCSACMTAINLKKEKIKNKL